MSDELRDAYGELYDPYPTLQAWRCGQADEAAAELWEKLHHQGDVNSASYAAVVELAQLLEASDCPDWNAYALMATIEECRTLPHNSPVPPALTESYHEAWVRIVSPALRHLADADDDTSVRSIIAVICHAKGQRSLGAMALLTEDERREML